MANDKWATPWQVYRNLDKEFNFDFDICAEHSTAKYSNYFTIDDDSLSKRWCEHGKRIWCNPPYSKILPWVHKAQKDGVLVVMLVFSDPSEPWCRYTKMFHTYTAIKCSV